MFRYKSINFIVIGCGGNGTRVLDKLSNWILGTNLKYWFLYLVDGDKIEQKNVERQGWESDSIGKFKAEELKNKYRWKMDRSQRVISFNEYLNKTSYLTYFCERDLNIFISCVDNNATRNFIWDFMLSEHENSNHKIKFRNWALMDLGNATEHGQVVTMVNYNQKLYGLDPREIYPNMKSKRRQEELPTTVASCSNPDVVESKPQTLFANEFTSLLAYQNIIDLVDTGKFSAQAEWAFNRDIGGEKISGFEFSEKIDLTKEDS